MFDAYRIGITATLDGNVMSALALWTKGFKGTTKEAEALNLRLNELKRTGKLAAIELGGAFIAVKPFKSMLTDAAKLQTVMLGIQNATSGTTDEMDALRATIEKIAGKTKFSSIDVSQMAKTVATGTGWDTATVNKNLLPFAQFADAQALLKHADPQKSVEEMVKLAHLGGYNLPEQISHYSDLLTRASLVTPGSVSEIGNALKYSQSALKNLGISDDDSVLMATALNRMGLSGTKGGTQLSAAITRSIPGIFGSGLLKGKSAEALKDMGFSDAKGHSTVFTDGKFDVVKWMRQLANYEDREYSSNPEAIARQHIAQNMQHAFGTNGSRVAQLLASPAARTALDTAREGLNSGVTTSSIQEMYASKSVEQQFDNAKTNITTLLTELGTNLLPAASLALKGFNTAISSLIGLVQEHPNIATGATVAGGVGVGALLYKGIRNAARFARSAMSLVGDASTGTAAEAAGAGGGLLSTAASKLAGTGGPLAFLTTLLKPTSTQTDAQEQAVLSALPPSRAGGNITVINKIDSQTVGSVMFDKMGRQVGGQNQSGAGVDYRRMPTPAGH